MTIQTKIDEAGSHPAEADRLYYIACIRRPEHPRGAHEGRLTCGGCVEVFFNWWEAFEKAGRLNYRKQTPHAYYEARAF